jgi:3-hydroxyisobutyrate dehydrogenase-like beta-hydroxyacid dehydrogenase
LLIRFAFWSANSFCYLYRFEDDMEPFHPGITTIGFIGIGKMGTPMSRHLRRGDYTVVAYDTQPEALERVRADGVLPAESLAEVGTKADVVITMLPDSNIVERVVLGKGGLAENMATGKLIIDMSSSYPRRTAALGKELTSQGIHMLGAPVSGGVIGAEAATLAIMPGGPKEIVDAAMPIFEVLGGNIVHIDEHVESGHAMKCVNNFLSATNLLSSMEALAFAAKLGLDPDKVLNVLNSGSGRNSGTHDKWPKFLLPRDFTCGFSTGLMHKDLTMGSDLAREVGATMFMLNHVREVYGLGVSRFGYDSDQTLLLEVIEEWVGQTVGEPSSKAPGSD